MRLLPTPTARERSTPWWPHPGMEPAPDHSLQPYLPAFGCKDPHRKSPEGATQGEGSGRTGGQAPLLRSPAARELLEPPTTACSTSRKGKGVIPLTIKGHGRGKAEAVTYLRPSSQTGALATQPRSRASAPEQNKPL